MSNPLVSIIMPAFQAEKTIHSAVESVTKCGLRPEQVEIIIATGDRETYNAAVPRWCTVKFVVHDASKSHPGDARNHALNMASGQFVAFLNAGDLWSPNYLHDAFVALGDGQIAFSNTLVMQEDREVLKLPSNEVDQLNYSLMSQAGAMFHPIVARELAGPFFSRAGEDIIHSMEILSLNGGTAPLSKSPYIVRIFPSSLQQNDEFSVALSASYQHYEKEIRLRHTRISDVFIPDAVRLLRRKSEINARYSATQYPGHFYAYVASEFKKGTPPWMGQKPSYAIANP